MVHVVAVLGHFPYWKVILVGDLNLDLDSIETKRDMEIANMLANSGLFDMHYYFKLCCKFKQRRTWHQKREENVIQLRLENFL